MLSEPTPVYRFSPSIKVSRYGEQALLWDPPTGSWCFVDEQTLPLIEGLKYLCGGLRREAPPPESHPLLEDLYHSGLVSRNGRFIWTPGLFAHHNNRVNTIILKVVGACNMGCSYCYDYNQARFGKTMDLDMARKALDGVWERSADALNVLFHGGEPTLAKKLIFALVPEIQRRADATGKKIFFSIQTNGTKLDEEWCALFASHQFSVGVSLDGDSAANDEFRITHSGKGTYGKIVDLLKRYGLMEKIGVLTTVTRHNVKGLVDAALHFQELGVKAWDTSVFQSAGRGAGKEDEFEPPVPDLVRAYLDLLQAVERGRFPDMEVRCILSYIRNVLSYKRTNMCLRTSCGAGADLVSISVDGAIEACDCITNSDLRLGRLDEADSISQALDSDVAASIRARHVDGLAPCHACDWRVVCGGSCLAKAGQLDGVVESECQLSLALFPAIMESLSKSDRLAEYAGRFA